MATVRNPANPMDAEVQNKQQKWKQPYPQKHAVEHEDNIFEYVVGLILNRMERNIPAKCS